MTDNVTLRVRVLRHTFDGKTYAAGDTFPGPARLAKALPDRLEVVESKAEDAPPAKEVKVSTPAATATVPAPEKKDAKAAEAPAPMFGSKD